MNSPARTESAQLGPPPMSRFAKFLSAHVPPGQFGRYVLIGAGNTLFGYGTFALFTALLDSVFAHGYILASVIASLLNITFSYLGYKFFVFKTRGNYLREWARCVAVYGTGILLGVVLLPIVVYLLRRGTGIGASAPYIAGALLMGFNVIYGFLGHKKFSFRQ
jgi:putative flippase GtrA